MLERGERVLDRRYGVPGGLDDDVNLRMRHQGLPSVTHMGRPRRERRIERRGRRTLGRPADAGKVGARVGGREIGDTHEMDARGLWHLR